MLVSNMTVVFLRQSINGQKQVENICYVGFLNETPLQPEFQNTPIQKVQSLCLILHKFKFTWLGKAIRSFSQLVTSTSLLIHSLHNILLHVHSMAGTVVGFPGQPFATFSCWLIVSAPLHRHMSSCIISKNIVTLSIKQRGERSKCS